MQPHRFNLLTLLVLAFFLLAACGGGSSGGETPAPEKRGEPLSVTSLPKSSYSVTELNQIRSSLFGGVFANFAANMHYDVAAYKIIYKTINPAGKIINASGVILLPLHNPSDQASVISYQHGTIFHNSFAPSNNLPTQELAAIIAAMNNVVILPDYIGYGESLAELHPYMHAESLANSVIDLVRAVKLHLAEIGFVPNNKLFLTGYSEGAYAAVAAHKMIQERYSAELTVTATLAGAGSYDLSTTARNQLAGDILTYGENAAFVYKAYDTIYGMNRVDQIFTTNYVAIVNAYFDGTHSDSQVSTITDITADLFKEPFLSNFRGEGETTIKQRLAENDIYDWKPDSPIRFFHGTQDVASPYQNSVTAFNTMLANGATQVELINCPAATPNHLQCATPYLEDMVEYILTH